jgi:hypothetical protein
MKNLTNEELKEINVHKYYLSEKAGCDVGLEFAIADWLAHHSKPWREKRMTREAQEQVQEIVKHKWCMSEQAGHDVGDQRAAIDWITKYARQWREWKLKKGSDPT